MRGRLKTRPGTGAGTRVRASAGGTRVGACDRARAGGAGRGAEAG